MVNVARQWRVWAVALLFASLFIAIGHTYAQSTPQAPAPNSVEVVGTIGAISGNIATINGLSVDISKIAVRATLKVGDTVKVEGVVTAAGSIAAREITTPKIGIRPGELEIVGVVDSISGTTLSIDGQAIDLSKADLKTGLANLTAGKTIKIEFSLDPASGQFVAREVNILPAKSTTKPTSPNALKTEIRGTLEQIGDGFVVISGQKISINAAEISGNLVVGALVKIELGQKEGADDTLKGKNVANVHPEEDRKPGVGATGTPSKTVQGSGTDDKGGSGSKGQSGSGNSGKDQDQHASDDNNNNKGQNNPSNDDHEQHSGSGNSGGGHDDGGNGGGDHK